MPSDIEQFIGKPVAKLSPADLQELRELGAAIRDGQTTFDEALKARYNTQTEEGTETGNAAQAETVAEEKIAAMSKAAVARQATAVPTEPSEGSGGKPAESPEMTDEDNRRLDAEIAAQEERPQTQRPRREKPVFGRQNA